jgi:TatA/E family protein of Tat protein translocase
MFGLGAGELLLILFLALIFIGPKKLPELAKALGQGIREFQKAKDDFVAQVNEPAAKETSTPVVASTETTKEESASSHPDQRA